MVISVMIAIRLPGAGIDGAPVVELGELVVDTSRQ